jgi:hypothetical protein
MVVGRRRGRAVHKSVGTHRALDDRAFEDMAGAIEAAVEVGDLVVGQLGNVLPTPTTKDTPQAFVPRIQFSCWSPSVR